MTALVALLGGAMLVSSAHAALFFLFEPTAARTGERVTVRLGGTPPAFTSAQRVKPYGTPIRLYLVAAADAPEVRGRFDPRLSFVGTLVPDKNGRGVLGFAAPPLDTGDYVLASWCPGCARFSAGRTFSVQTVPEVSRYRRWMGLRVEMPDPATACPVTKGSYGNGLLSTSVPGRDGLLVVQRQPDETLFDKLSWLPRKGFSGDLTVRGERLDAPGALRVLSVNWGHSSNGRGSWASAVVFPSEGCWRITGRVRDVSLTYVVKVASS